MKDFEKTYKLRLHQVRIFTMCGGGFIGHFAATQPADFYIDDRVGKLPYKKKEIYLAVEHLRRMADEAGLDPKRLEFDPNWD